MSIVEVQTTLNYQGWWRREATQRRMADLAAMAQEDLEHWRHFLEPQGDHTSAVGSRYAPLPPPPAPTHPPDLTPPGRPCRILPMPSRPLLTPRLRVQPGWYAVCPNVLRALHMTRPNRCPSISAQAACC